MRNVCGSLKAMTNADFQIGARTPQKALHLFREGFTVVSHFSGRIQGDFILSTNEPTAAKIAGATSPSMPIAERRESFAGCMCEAMNISAHHSLELLQRNFGALTLLPPAWIFGEYHTVDFVSGVGVISGTCGQLQCSLVLNLAGLHEFESHRH